MGTRHRLVCPQGHPLTGENVSVQLNGNGNTYVRCRACHREKARAWREANRDYKRAQDREYSQRRHALVARVPQ